MKKVAGGGLIDCASDRFATAPDTTMKNERKKKLPPVTRTQAEDAVRTLRLAREAGGWNLVKLEVLGPPPLLYPDMQGTFEAAEALIKDGFEVMVYCADDPLAAKRLEDMGCVAIMPLGAPI